MQGTHPPLPNTMNKQVNLPMDQEEKKQLSKHGGLLPGLRTTQF